MSAAHIFFYVSYQPKQQQPQQHQVIGGGTGNMIMTDSFMSPTQGQGNGLQSFNQVHQRQHVNGGKGNMTAECCPQSQLPHVFQEQIINGGTGTMEMNHIDGVSHYCSKHFPI